LEEQWGKARFSPVQSNRSLNKASKSWDPAAARTRHFERVGRAEKRRFIDGGESSLLVSWRLKNPRRNFAITDSETSQHALLSQS